MNILNSPDFWLGAVRAIASIATLVMTIVVYKITKGLAHTSTNKEINTMWQSFNSLMLQNDHIGLLESFLARDGEYEATSHSKVHYILFSFLNCLYLEYVTGKQEFMNKQHFDSSLSAHLSFLAPRKAYVLDLMEQNGFDPRFIELIRNHTPTEADSGTIEIS